MSKYQRLCITEGFFTRGDNEQYMECIGYARQYEAMDIIYASDLEALVYMTYICSDIKVFPVNYVRESIRALYADKLLIDTEW